MLSVLRASDFASAPSKREPDNSGLICEKCVDPDWDGESYGGES